MVIRESWQVVSAFLLFCGLFLFFFALREWRSSGLSEESIGALFTCLFCVFFGRSLSGQRIVGIDVGRQHIEWTRTLLFRPDKIKTVPLRAIKSAIVEQKHDTEGKSYRAAVITHDGATIPITTSYYINRHVLDQITEYIRGQIPSDGDSLIR
jgi:hypothetical protein